jgi:hypothetical protein
MGIDPQILISTFLNDFFRTDKITDFILTGIAKLATANYKQLNSSASLSFVPNPNNSMTDEEIVELTDSNYSWLNSQVLIKKPLEAVINVYRIRMIQELMVLIFGKPKKEEAAYGSNGLCVDINRFNELINEALCGGDKIFSVSNPVNNRFGDLEYNRLQKLSQIEKGDLSFQITCQDVKITLPDDPMYLFESAPPGIAGGAKVSPQEAITNVFNLVGNQVQRANIGEKNQSNAESAKSSFSKKLLETLISSITVLIRPILIGFTGTIPSEFQGLSGNAINLVNNGLLNIVFPNSVTTNPISGVREGDFVPPDSCKIINSYDKENLTPEQKNSLLIISIFCNLILNMAISFLLSYVIQEVKKLVKKYIAKRAQAKMERKMEKIKKQYENTLIGRSQKKAERTARQVKLMQKIIKLLNPKKNPGTNNF